jgi:hypothetical protein
MRLVGVDLHTREQSIAMVDTENDDQPREIASTGAAGDFTQGRRPPGRPRRGRSLATQASPNLGRDYLRGFEPIRGGAWGVVPPPGRCPCERTYGGGREAVRELPE